MALIKCNGCGHMVSDKGTKCPKCGMPIQKSEPTTPAEKPQRYKDVIYGILVVTTIVVSFWWQNDVNKYIPLNIESIKYERDETPTYSVELVEHAEKGDAVAQYNLGICYVNGDGVAQDYGEAVKWMRKAAEQGNERAVQWLNEFMH